IPHSLFARKVYARPEKQESDYKFSVNLIDESLFINANEIDLLNEFTNNNQTTTS
ncbi:6392_t:CDS:1, partial [Funneliformis mosseae]